MLVQALINSSIVPGMTFQKTSAKFGQWTDVRAGTVYGLGFAAPDDLEKVVCLLVVFIIITEDSICIGVFTCGK